MRILFVTNYYPPYEVGGYEQLCRDVVQALEERGHTCCVLTSRRGAAGQDPVNPQVHRLLHIQPDYEARLSPALQFLFTRRRYARQDLASFQALCHAFQPDVVFIWNLQGLPRALAVAAESLPEVGVASWLAGYSPAEPDEFWNYWAQAPRRRAYLGKVKEAVSRVALATMRHDGVPLRPQLTHVAVVSEYMRRIGLARGVLPEHTLVIYNGVEDMWFRPRASRAVGGLLRLLYAGRLSEDKGAHVAIAAMRCLANDLGVASASLTIAGSGPEPYVSRLRALVREHRLEDSVTFLGWQPRERMPELMAEHDVYLLCSSVEEAFSRAVLEAMASGLAVVGTLTGGTGEILVEGQTGLTFPVGDSEALARQIRRLAEEPGLLDRLARNGQRVVYERFRMEHMVNEIERLLSEALAEHRGPGRREAAGTRQAP